MSTSLHLHSELLVASTMDTRKWIHYNHHFRVYDIQLYALLGGRTCCPVKCIFDKMKGFPKNASEITEIDRYMKQGDVHTTNWLDMNEIKLLSDTYEKLFRCNLTDHGLDYLFGNGWDSWIKYPDSWEPYKKLGVSGFRFIYWFTT